MSERLVPQRWVDAPRPPNEPYNAYPDVVTTQDSESVLQVVNDVVGLLRRHWLLVTLCVAVSLSILAVLLRREQPIYRAAALIRLTDQTKSMAGGLGVDASDQLGGSITDPILSDLQVLQSRGIARDIVQNQGLQLQSLTRGLTRAYIDSVSVSPDATADTLQVLFGDSAVTGMIGSAHARAPYGTPLVLPGVRMTVTHRPPLDAGTFVVLSMESAIDDVVRNLKGRARDRTDVVDVTFESPDPVLAKRTTDAAIEVFQAANARTARQQSVRRREFIEQQLAKSDAMLAEAQTQHNAFRSRLKTYSAQDKFKAQQSDVTDLELRRQELATDRQIYAGLLAALDSVPAGKNRDERLNALVSSPGIAANPVVAQMFGDLLKLRATRDSLVSGPAAASRTNPDVKRLDALIAVAQSDVESAVRGQISATDARLTALDALQAKSTAQLATLPSTEAQEADLLAQVQTYADQSERLREELQKAQIEEAAQAGDVEIIDPATLPRKPIGSGRAPKFVLALILGLGLGGALAYVLENYGAVIRKRDDLERAIGMPNLAVIPRIRSIQPIGARGKLKRLAEVTGNGRNGAAPITGSPVELVTINDVRSNGAEAYRTLRTNVLFSSAVQSLRTVVVTSAGPGEGKSTTAANLAIAFAQQGHRVLLVDCDLRRPRIHKLFGARQEPGLTNVLLGSTTLAAAQQDTMVPNLIFLAAGPLPPNPVEMLGSPAMRQLVESSAGVDMIVLDTPPLLVASDAAVLGRGADGVIVVVRAGHTQRAAVQEAAQQLSAVGARVIGTVLNDPDSETAKYSTYYQYYSSEYYEYADKETV